MVICNMKKQRRNNILILQISSRLKEIRLEKKLSQETVYFNTDIHIGRVEAGQYNITISTLYELCKYYDITLVDFFKGIKE